MLKQAVYFYKENNNNIPVAVASCNDVKTIFFPADKELEKINSEYPESKGNLYVLVDGVTFKLNF